jgi:hypothetical protein
VIGVILKPFSSILICGVTLASLILSAAQEQDSLTEGLRVKTTDSLKSSTTIFLPADRGYFKPTSDQMLKLWVIQHQSQIWEEISISDYRSRGKNKYGFGDLFKSYNNLEFNYPGLELRESSIYIPQNVRDYTDFKMGRDRYLPFFNPVLIGFMLYHVSQYARQFFNNDDNIEVRAGVSDTENSILLLLENEYPLEVNRWFRLYVSDYQDSLMTIDKFRKIVQDLEERALMKPRTFEDGTVKFYPSADSSCIRMKLKK